MRITIRPTLGENEDKNLCQAYVLVLCMAQQCLIPDEDFSTTFPIRWCSWQ